MKGIDLRLRHDQELTYILVDEVSKTVIATLELNTTDYSHPAQYALDTWHEHLIGDEHSIYVKIGK